MPLMCRYHWKSEEGMGSPGTGVTGGSLSKGAGNLPLEGQSVSALNHWATSLVLWAEFWLYLVKTKGQCLRALKEMTRLQGWGRFSTEEGGQPTRKDKHLRNPKSTARVRESRPQQVHDQHTTVTQHTYLWTQESSQKHGLKVTFEKERFSHKTPNFWLFLEKKVCI